MQVSLQSVLGWVSRRAKHWHIVHPCVYEAMDSSGSGTVLFTTHTAGSRVESVLYQKDARVAPVETAY